MKFHLSLSVRIGGGGQGGRREIKEVDPPVTYLNPYTHFVSILLAHSDEN